MRGDRVAFAGWPGGARAVAPELFRKRDAETARQLDLLLRVLTPQTVFMQKASTDRELGLRAAGYVERVWCVGADGAPVRGPCNLRCAPLGGVPMESVDVAFSERLADPEDVGRALKPSGVWFIYGELVPLAALRPAGFRRLQYYAGNVALPRPIARFSRIASTAAYK